MGVPEEQKKQMKMAIWMSPFMTFFISLTSSAGLGLYFFIGGLFAILQTLMINAYRPRIRRQIAEENKKNPVKVPDALTTNNSASKATDNLSATIDQLKESAAPVSSATPKPSNRSYQS